ncbi:MAG: hypothetical protein Q4G70_08990 [Pseudomonadota bacterium]|nr:hypothetical protein [Pseudomonadota bacterium]
MSSKPSLYQLFGVGEHATAEQIREAFLSKSDEVRANAQGLPPEDVNDRLQVLKLALTTLVDPITRHAYDTKLRAQANTQALVTTNPSSPDAAQAQAEALSMRADALSLRADALMIRAGAGAERDGSGGGFWQNAAGGLLNRFANAIGLVVIFSIVLGFASRAFFGGGSTPHPAAIEARQNKAQEQAALQEYYQTYGVRPANMAELELLEANRRRDEIAQRQARQNEEQAEAQMRRFEEDARRRGEEVSRNLQWAEEQSRRYAAEEDARLQRLALEREQLAAIQAAEERQRQLENERRWRETLRR